MGSRPATGAPKGRFPAALGLVEFPEFGEHPAERYVPALVSRLP